MAEEYILILDKNNRPIGKKTRKEVHERGLWHRAAHVWVYNKRGEVLLQKRSLNVDLFPGLWDVSAAGHALYGDSYMKTALKELKEELGLKISKNKLKELGIIRGINKTSVFVSREFQKIYLLELNLDIKNIKFDPQGISEIKFFKIHKLKQMLSHKEKRKMFVPSYAYWLKVFGKIEILKV